jgi:hypothetical protein
VPFKALTIAGLLSVSCSAAEASSLDAYAGVVGGAGNGSTSTFGPPAELSFFVLSYLPIPLGGISQTGYTGGISQVSAASGPLTNSMSVGPVILGNPTFGAFFDGTANSVANYGSLGASAHANILGGLPGNPLALFSSAGAAKFSDTFTVSSPLVASTSAGFVRYQFSVDGSLTSLGTPAPFFFGGTLATLVIQQQGGPVYEILVAQVYRGETGTILGSPPPPGWTTSMGSLSGGSTFYSLDLPMNWGQPWDVSVGLLAQAYGTADTNFLTTAKLTGLELFDANHVQVTQFSINSVSGTDYINAGPTPEPATMLLLGTGLAALAGARKLKKQLPA